MGSIGIKKIIAKEKQSGGGKPCTGKRPLSFLMYEKLCDYSLLLPDCGFTHLFLVMSWSLMCRSNSTQTIRFDHLSCEDDAIGVTFYKTKTKQEGILFRFIFIMYIQ